MVIISKIREKGILYCLNKVLKLLAKLGLILISILSTPMAIVLSISGIRFIDVEKIFGRIGHIALLPDFYVKSKLLNYLPNFHCIILAPSKSVANRFLLNYWNKYFKILSNSIIIKFLKPLAMNTFLKHELSSVKLFNEKHIKMMPGLYYIQKRYEKEYNGHALLKLRNEHIERGWRCLQKIGVRSSSWFICLHVREGGYLPHLKYHSYRDADIDSYIMMIEEIVRRGGWVFRIGDKSMKSLSKMNRVVDYAHGDYRSEWMDIFLLSQCKFSVGTTSGPPFVSFAFGVPCALTNFAPIGYGPYSSRDIWIPKLYWSSDENRYMKFDEAFKFPHNRFSKTEDFEAAGISLIDNSPEDIRDIAVEMLNKIDGKIKYSEEDERLQKSFKTLLESDDPKWGTVARVGKNFLTKYAFLLQNEESDIYKIEEK